ncbi:hypothetical protein D3C84_1200950 [compost metagenome]
MYVEEDWAVVEYFCEATIVLLLVLCDEVSEDGRLVVVIALASVEQNLLQFITI